MRTLIAFDLDGTLIDSRQDLADSANAMLGTYGAGALDTPTIAGYVGDGARELVRRTLEGAELSVPLDEALDRFLAAYQSRLTTFTRPYLGITEMLAALAGRATLAVVTNKPVGPSRRILEAFGLDGHFAWIIGGDSPFGRKPDPAALVHVVRALGVSGERSLYVGDSDVDAQTARRAGVRFCLADYGFGQVRGRVTLAPGDVNAGSSADLLALIETFLASA